MKHKNPTLHNSDTPSNAAVSAANRLVRSANEGYKAIAKLRLANEVFDVAYADADSLDHDGLGRDLAYLLGVILSPTPSFVDWSKDVMDEPPALFFILDEHLPEDHAVWKFIRR